MEFNDKLAELNSRKDRLELQVATHKAELDRMDASKLFDPGKYNSEQMQLTYAKNKLNDVLSEIASLTGAAETAQAELFSQFESIEIDGMPFSLRDLAKGEAQYQVISEFFQRHVGDLAQQHVAVISSYKSQIEAMEDDLLELEQVRKLNMEYSDKLADMELRRDAAADELHQAKEEINRLREDNKQLREKLEAPAKTVTNTNQSASEIARKLHEAKPAIYNKRWKDDLSKKVHLAELAETGETIEIPWLEIGRYREVTAEEAERFRQELAAQKKIEMEAAAQTATTDLITPSLSQEPTYTLDTDETIRQDDAPVTRQEFQQLEERVANLERLKSNVA